jgi:hypothetical protein
VSRITDLWDRLRNWRRRRFDPLGFGKGFDVG